MNRHIWGFVAGATLGLLLLCWPAEPLRANEAQESLGARMLRVAGDVDRHRRAQDVYALEGDLEALVRIHADAGDDPAIRSKALHLLGRILKTTRDTSLKVQALQALGRTADESAARHVKPYLRLPRAKDADDLLRAAVRAAGQVPAASLATPLLTVLEKSRRTGATLAALESLGSFHAVTRYRVRILETALDVVRRARPSSGGRMKGRIEGQVRGGGVQIDRWVALSLALPGVLSRLTGREVPGATAADWLDLAKEYKGRMQRLFVDED